MKNKERVAKSFLIKDIYGKNQITGAKRLNKDKDCMRCQNHWIEIKSEKMEKFFFGKSQKSIFWWASQSVLEAQ